MCLLRSLFFETWWGSMCDLQGSRQCVRQMINTGGWNLGQHPD